MRHIDAKPRSGHPGPERQTGSPRRANSPDPKGAGWGYGGEATMGAKRNSGQRPHCCTAALPYFRARKSIASVSAQRHQARRRQGSLARRGETAKLARCASTRARPDAQGRSAPLPGLHACIDFTAGQLMAGLANRPSMVGTTTHDALWRGEAAPGVPGMPRGGAGAPRAPAPYCGQTRTSRGNWCPGVVNAAFSGHQSKAQADHREKI